MSRISVNGVELAYDTFGTSGPWIFWSNGGRESIRQSGYPICKALAAEGYRVVTYDLRNRGESQFTLNTDRSEWDDFADDLHALIQELAEPPVITGGGSGGMMVSLRHAGHYPADVRALLALATPSDDSRRMLDVSFLLYRLSGMVATANGMPKLLELELGWRDWGALASKNPQTGSFLRAADPREFNSSMLVSAEYLEGGRTHFGGLSDQRLRTLDVPTLVLPGSLNALHPLHTAVRLSQLLPRASFVDPRSYFQGGELEAVPQGSPEAMAVLAPILLDYLRGLDL